jgi:hypothetical protein
MNAKPTALDAYLARTAAIHALLLGLFYTADGEKYQPAFTKKANGRRYR